MNKLGSGGLFVIAIALVIAGLFLRLDLIDWLIDAVGFLFIAGGLVMGMFGVFNWATSRKGGSSAY